MNLTVDQLAPTISTIDSWLSYQQRYLRVPGVQVAVQVGEDMVLSTAYGHADLSTREALRPDHRIRVASHSKVVTATAVMQLVEAGRLRLDDTLAQHLPWTAGTGLSDRTLRQLLSHSAGVFRDSDDARHWQLDVAFPDTTDLRDRVLAGGETHGSNVRFKYSNIGYALIGAVIEGVVGTTWGEHVAAHVLEPAGMTSSGPDWFPDVDGVFATAYSGLSWADERVPIEQVCTHALAPATGVYSTAEDLCRLASGHFDGADTLLQEPSKREMRSGPVPVEGMDGAWYGLGLMINAVKGRRLFGHGGGWPGSITRTMFDPDGRFAVSVLTTAIDGPASVLAEGICKMLIHADGTTSQHRTTSPRAAETDEALGRYVYLWGVRDLVRVGSDLLLTDATSGDPLAGATWLEPNGPDSFVMTRGLGFGSVGELLRLERDERGSVCAIKVGGTRMTRMEQTPQPDRADPVVSQNDRRTCGGRSGRFSSSGGRGHRPLGTYSQAATFGWSIPEAPTFAAPPGDPTPDTESSKYSALTGVNSFHSSGTSSS